ncbi:hypothetical protein [Streptomyces sp. NRRL S-495]|uniref:hypothetical protein n=1 Tax=Streptomyces sp. NRRL S-495 TaxID=1609133 RepID=UPI00133138A8|nr:hypothetical protein [Streptomyces sp. NRRL S-495]
MTATSTTRPVSPTATGDGNAYHKTRFANGNWSGFGAVQGPYGASVFPAQRAAIAGLPDGSSQLVITRG